MLTRAWTAHVRPEWKVTVTAPTAEERDELPPADKTAASGTVISAGTDDEALVVACLAGQREAFDLIVERHRRHVYQLCYRFVGNHEDASDLAQDVFIRAYRALGKFKRQSSLSTWLYRIGVNVCLNRVSLKTPAPRPLIPDDRLVSSAEHPADAMLREERAAQVRAAIAQLPRKQRATLVLRVYHDLPHEQIAGILGSSVGAVKANFFHALKNLKRLLHDQ
jgi:RNA polymerase sigma-70 factor, ECF subfamily